MAKSEADMELEKTKNSLKIDFLQNEARVKKELMILEWELNSKIKSEERETANKMESVREDRKDQRVDRQAEHQKGMIEQRKGGEQPKKFESSGNDIVTGNAGIGKFGPR